MKAYGLEVTIDKVGGLPYPEHHKSQSSKILEKYLESKPGEKFQIVVRVHPNFTPHGATWLKIQWFIDGQQGWIRYCPVPKRPNGASILVESNMYYKRDGQFYQADQVFADHNVDDSSRLGTRDIDELVKKGAKVRVQIERLLTKVDTVWSAFDREESRPTDNVPIKIIKDKKLDQVVKPANEQSMTAGALGSQITKVPEPHTTVLDVTFHYRGRAQLQRMHVIPPDPMITSTAPVDLTKLPDDPPSAETEERTIIDLESDTPTHTVLKREPNVGPTIIDLDEENQENVPPVMLKRERVELEDDEDIDAQLALLETRRKALEARRRTSLRQVKVERND